MVLETFALHASLQMGKVPAAEIQSMAERLGLSGQVHAKSQSRLQDPAQPVKQQIMFGLQTVFCEEKNLQHSLGTNRAVQECRPQVEHFIGSGGRDLTEQFGRKACGVPPPACKAAIQRGWGSKGEIHAESVPEFWRDTSDFCD
jgi:hypothetical protein